MIALNTLNWSISLIYSSFESLFNGLSEKKTSTHVTGFVLEGHICVFICVFIYMFVNLFIYLVSYLFVCIYVCFCFHWLFVSVC